MIKGDLNSENASTQSSDGRSIRFPPWLITYSDLITLLLTFFILLMSMADLDPVRFNEASNSLKGAFGIRPQPAGSEVIVPVFPAPPVSENDRATISRISKIYQDIRLDIENLGNTIDKIRALQPDSDTLLVRINESLLFTPGSDHLLPESYPFLDKIGRSIKDHPIDIRIEGHTDDIETTDALNTNNWELSTARAVSVLRFFVQQGFIPVEQLSAVGYGSEQPVIQNTTDSNRLLNRRVDILLQANFSSGTTPAKDTRSIFPL